MAGKKRTWAEKQEGEDNAVRKTEGGGGSGGSNDSTDGGAETDPNDNESFSSPADADGGVAGTSTADPDEAFDGTSTGSPDSGNANSNTTDTATPPAVDPVKPPRKPRVQREKLGFRGHTARISAVASILGAHTNLTGNIDLTIDQLADLIREAPEFADSIDLIDEARTKSLYKQARQMLILGGAIDHDLGKLAPKPRKPRADKGVGRGSSGYKAEMEARNAADQAAALEAYEASLRKPDVGGEDGEGEDESTAPHDRPDA